MMTRFAMLLFVALGCVSLAGCGGDNTPEPLSADQEKQLDEQLQQAQQEEAAQEQTAAP